MSLTRVLTGAQDVAQDAARRGMSTGDMIRAGLITSAAGATGGIVIGGTAFAGFTLWGDQIVDAAGNVVEDINLVVGLGTARAEARTWRESFMAMGEQIASAIYNFTGGDFLLRIINQFRAGQNNLEPLVRTGEGNGLIEASRYSPLETGPAPAAGVVPPAITGPFNLVSFRTELENAVIDTELGRTTLESYPMPEGVEPSAVARAAAANRTIQELELDPLMETLRATAPHASIEGALDIIRADESLSADFDAARRAGGINSITAIFTEIARGGEDITPEIVRAAIPVMTPATP